MSRYARAIRPHVAAELGEARAAEIRADASTAFAHLERAHVLGQASTLLHVRVHWRMLRLGLKRRDARECLGQTFRIAGAATKTVFGLVPEGNTGGANVSPFVRIPLPPELKARIDAARASTG